MIIFISTYNEQFYKKSTINRKLQPLLVCDFQSLTINNSNHKINYWIKSNPNLSFYLIG